MRQRALISVLILFCLKIGAPSAQVPTLDPAQTVNTATGEMGFSLSLGVVEGNNGNNAPINLSYQAGIQLHQQSTNIGLGFSALPGVITRQVVITPDEEGDDYWIDQNGFRNIQPWFWVVSGILLIASVIVAAISQQYELPVALVISVSSFITTTVLSHIASKIAFGSHNYIAGGTHVPTLPTDYWKRPKGRSNGDLPDIFRISTPYINGEFYWETREECFKMRQCGGSAVKDMETVQINFYAKNFTIKLADGMKLHFEKQSLVNPYMYTFHQEYPDGSDSYAMATVEYNNRYTNNWYLTGVTFPDYIDENGNQTIDNEDRGSWIRYEYDEIRYLNSSQLTFNRQASTNATTIAYNGYLSDVYLKKIITPVSYAEYKYKDGRLDDLWLTLPTIDRPMIWGDRSGIPNEPSNQRSQSYTDEMHADKSKGIGGNAQSVNRRVLDEIVIFNRKNIPISKIKFNTDYTLRPSTFYSFTKTSDGNYVPADMTNNPAGACLTLKSISFLNGDESPAILGTIQFQYSELNPPAWDKMKRGAPPFPLADISRVNYYVEPKDLWGYYYPNTQTAQSRGYSNYFPWEVEERGIPYAEAWSLKNVSFSNGMKIWWDYESNKYDKSNNVNCAKSDGLPRIGGGIRVKKVHTSDGMGHEYSWRYFYTSGRNLEEFVDETNDTSNSSGYATVHPYNYIGDVDYRDGLHLAKGGLYTPAKVSYEMVKVAKNYDEINNIAPEGYTVDQYTSTIEYPNGDYKAKGEIDYSFLRGMPISNSVYSKDGKLLARKTKEYKVTENNITTSNDYRIRTYPSAWFYLSKEKEWVQGTESEKEYQYAREGGPDVVVAEKQEQLNNYFSENMIINEQWVFSECGYSNGAITSCDFDLVNCYGEQNKKDLVAGMGGSCFYEYNMYLLLILGEDIEFKTTQVPFKWKYCLLKFPYQHNTGNRFVNGFALNDISNNNVPDAIILENVEGYLGYQVAFDIDASKFSETGNYYQLPGTKQIHHKTDFNLCATNSIACAGIKNIVSSSSKDLVVVQHSKVNTDAFFQIIIIGGLLPDGTYTNVYKSDIFNDDEWTKNISAEITEIAGTNSSKSDIILTRFTPAITKRLFEDIYIDASGKVCATFRPSWWYKYPIGGVQSINFSPDVYHLGAVYPSPDVYSYQKPVYLAFEYYPANPCLHNGRIKTNVVGTTPLYYDYDGQPNMIKEKKQNYQICTEIQQAYFKYKDLAIFHRLTPIAETKTYNSTASGYQWLAMDVTTWGIRHRWLYPKANYKWKTAMTPEGFAAENPPDFIFSNHQNNDWSKWQLIDSAGSFNNKHNIVEILEPGPNGKKVCNTTVIGNKGLALAQITNANFKESGVFTCDYDLDETGQNGTNYFDLENGWERGGVKCDLCGSMSVLSEDAKHFGKKGILVRDAYGPTRNFKLTKDRDYILSAWIKPWDPVYTPVGTNPSLVMGIDYRCSRDVTGTVWPIALYSAPYPGANPADVKETRACSQIPKAKQYGDWYFVELQIPASSDLSDEDWNAGYQYARVWVGCPGQTGGVVYIDDIRFYPKDAIVTSTYYDENWYQPILRVDPNNKPGQRVTYDEFGRPKLWERLDLTKATTHDEYAKEVMEKEYHLMGIAE